MDIPRLSPAQKEVLEKILQCAAEDPVPPTLQKIADMRQKKSRSNAGRIARALEVKGLISMVTADGSKRLIGRSIRPTPLAWDWWKSQGHGIPDFIQTVPERTDNPIAEATYSDADRDDRIGRIPLLGGIPAGQPALREQDDSDSVSLEDLFEATSYIC